MAPPVSPNRHIHACRISLTLAACIASLGGCATYKPLPLPTTATLPSDPAALHGAAQTSEPLTIADVERLVLLNSPELVSARSQRGIAQAQMLQDGLLPNPSVNAGIGYLLSGVGDSTAWTAGISQDIKSLITLAPRREAARANAAKVDASLLWQEWQTVAKARLLVVDIVEGERLLDVQTTTLTLLDKRSARVRQAVTDGNAELAAATPALAAAADARVAHDELDRKLKAQRRDLNTLLGISSKTVLPLAPLPSMTTLDAGKVRADLSTLAQRRPDLVALRLGYTAQEATLRAAVLAQFPVLSIGYSASQDNSRVRNGGPTVTFDLPVFDRNQHVIAVESATRQQLHDEYTARLATSTDEVDALLDAQQTFSGQLAAGVAALPEADRTDERARQAFDAGLMDMRAYVDLAVASLARRTAVITLEQAMLEQRVALDTLIGTGMPATLPRDVTQP
ncbi:outer membrane protein TolC [Luteibacter rhizovicinus]|uniref:Outer membrane protein TolC n=1 Tax=Luteibacter rhizovicinus TaxID=242606 RepID=A0A4R3YGX4_9GAMM|nr:TolC family protein [Luteibacter rhizovicinus]TCV91446.1 outer membrane protein TolC [Luteibacter rhizovicinus]